MSRFSPGVVEERRPSFLEQVGEGASGIAASRAARAGLPPQEAARAAALAQAKELQDSSWRVRFLALASALAKPELVNPMALATEVLELAPAARAPIIPTPENVESLFDIGAHLSDRVAASKKAGRAITKLSTDEASAVAAAVLLLALAVQELTGQTDRSMEESG